MTEEINSPTLLPDGERYSGEETYTRSQLKDMEYKTLRQMAAQVESDAVNGKSTKFEIIEFFTNHKTLTDF